MSIYSIKFLLEDSFLSQGRLFGSVAIPRFLSDRNGIFHEMENFYANKRHAVCDISDERHRVHQLRISIACCLKCLFFALVLLISQTFFNIFTPLLRTFRKNCSVVVPT